MGKNLDTDNIFNSYINRVILNEGLTPDVISDEEGKNIKPTAVKPTEQPPSPTGLTPQQLKEKFKKITGRDYDFKKEGDRAIIQKLYNGEAVNPLTATTSNAPQPEAAATPTPSATQQSIKVTKDTTDEEIMKLISTK
jgi:hypothetical protein